MRKEYDTDKAAILKAVIDYGVVLVLLYPLYKDMEIVERVREGVSARLSYVRYRISVAKTLISIRHLPETDRDNSCNM